jgi:hypothetical protein
LPPEHSRSFLTEYLLQPTGGSEDFESCLRHIAIANGNTGVHARLYGVNTTLGIFRANLLKHGVVSLSLSRQHLHSVFSKDLQLFSSTIPFFFPLTSMKEIAIIQDNSN